MHEHTYYEVADADREYIAMHDTLVAAEQDFNSLGRYHEVHLHQRTSLFDENNEFLDDVDGTEFCLRFRVGAETSTKTREVL